MPQNPLFSSLIAPNTFDCNSSGITCKFWKELRSTHPHHLSYCQVPRLFKIQLSFLWMAHWTETEKKKKKQQLWDNKHNRLEIFLRRRKRGGWRKVNCRIYRECLNRCPLLTERRRRKRRRTSGPCTAYFVASTNTRSPNHSIVELWTRWSTCEYNG